MTDQTAEANTGLTALRSLKFGASVAEFDENLERYFVETDTFRALIENRCDIIAGDKGTGKTALYRILRDRYKNYDELNFVEVIPAFNSDGAPIFVRLLETELLPEPSYEGVWKAYILSLVGNFMLELADGDFSEDMVNLDRVLRSAGLRSADDSPGTIFSQLANKLKRLASPAVAEASVTVLDTGHPVFATRLEFEHDDEEAREAEPFRRYDDALRLLDRIVDAWGVSVWIALDRLDEAFPSRPDLEKRVLRALLRTYLDFQEFSHLRLKLFMRRDLFARVVEGGFVNLTHVNARRVDIEWDSDDLYQLLYERIQDNTDFTNLVGIRGADADQSFSTLLPPSVDSGPRKPTTWRWILSRIGDGNAVRPPRNLIDLMSKAREAQMRKESRQPRAISEARPVIESDAIKKGLEALSTTRVEDTLLAEAADLAPTIERFRGGKAGHNEASLATVLGANDADTVKRLQRVGFLEAVGSSYKVPILYRSGLNISQGRAYRDQDAERGVGLDEE